jgi:putative transposase
MTKLVAYKYRLYPNKTQQTMLNKTFGCVRYFWNNQIATFRGVQKK